MRFEFEEFLHVSGNLSPEEQAEITKLLQASMKGAKQNIIGEKRREIAEGFIKLLEPERMKRLEEEISALHIIKDESRFRTQLLTMLCESFIGGVVSAQDMLMKMDEHEAQKAKKDTPEKS